MQTIETKLFNPILKRAKKAMNRPTLTTPHYDKDKGELVATDGKVLVVVLTKSAPQGDYITPKTKDLTYPNYKQVIPGYRKGCIPYMAGDKYVTVDYKNIRPQIKQALAVMKGGKEIGADCHFIKDKLQLCCCNMDIASMHHNQANKDNYMIHLNIKFISEIVMMFHKLKENTFKLYVTDELSLAVLVGVKMYAVIMPMRKN